MGSMPKARRPADYESENERITDRTEIVSRLRRMKEGRELLAVRLPDTSKPGNSAILKVDAHRKLLVLDELNPPEYHSQVRPGTVLKLHARCQGVDMHFTTKVLAVEGKDGIAFYRASLPATLMNRQRRSHFRVKVESLLEIPVEVPIGESEVLQGSLVDVSVGGLALEIPETDSLKQGTVLNACSIALPSGEKLNADVEIRFVALNKESHRERIGGRFQTLNRGQEARLARFVARVEREILRNRSK